MCQKEMLWSIRGKKGVYTFNEPAENEKDEIHTQQGIDDELEDLARNSKRFPTRPKLGG